MKKYTYTGPVTAIKGKPAVPGSVVELDPEDKKTKQLKAAGYLNEIPVKEEKAETPGEKKNKR